MPKLSLRLVVFTDEYLNLHIFDASQQRAVGVYDRPERAIHATLVLTSDEMTAAMEALLDRFEITAKLDSVTMPLIHRARAALGRLDVEEEPQSDRL